jgi:hypothetical protein
VQALPGGAILTREEAVVALVQLPKPTVCSVEARAGITEIRCLKFDDLDSSAKTEVMADRGFEKDDALFPDLANATDGSRHPSLALCVGYEEDLVVPLQDADGWYRTYYNPSPWKGGYSMRGDELDNPYSKDSPKYVAARNRGAAVILEFSPPAQNSGFIMGFDATSGDLEGLAVSPRDLASIPAGADSMAELERTLRAFAVVATRNLGATPDSNLRSKMAPAAAMMRKVWGERPMPPEVANFVKQFGRTTP